MDDRYLNYKLKHRFVVGHNDIDSGVRRRSFPTQKKAAEFIERVFKRRDPKGVNRGDYYLIDMKTY